MTPTIRRAFILGAGLGTRLRPQTLDLPKPLVQVRGRPLVTYAMDQLIRVGVREVMINTHHAAHQWSACFPKNEYRDLKISFRHEPLLLDTGGGLKNVEDFFQEESTFIIYNGDILSEIELNVAITDHLEKKNISTLILRSNVEPRHIHLNPDGRIVDIRNRLKTGSKPTHLFTGIHIVDRNLLGYIEKIEPISIIDIYLRLIQSGHRIGGFTQNEGTWTDVGTPEEYERVNRLA